jgi:hypothetical protein
MRVAIVLDGGLKSCCFSYLPFLTFLSRGKA